MIQQRSIIKSYEACKWKLLRFIRRNTLFSSIASLCIIVLATGVTINSIEGGDSFNGLYRSAVYLLSGLDVDPPRTATGKLLASIILLVGVVFVSLLTGFIASEFTRILSNSHSVPLKPSKARFQDHVIIFGWSNKSKLLLEELSPDFKAGNLTSQEFVIVSDETYLDKGNSDIYSQVFHVRGQATDSDVLMRADLAPVQRRRIFGDRISIGGAKAAVVFSDSKLPPTEADRHTLLSLLAVEHLHPNVISIVESRTKSNVHHMQNAYADEVLLPTQYTNDLIARSAEFPGSYSFISDLLSLASSTEDHLPISLQVLKSSLVGVTGLTAKEAAVKVFEQGLGIMIGLLGDKNYLLFSEDIITGSLTDNDRLVVIATPDQVDL